MIHLYVLFLEARHNASTVLLSYGYSGSSVNFVIKSKFVLKVSTIIFFVSVEFCDNIF